jgi:TfoX/Sxy family transcriptional regulator of competence genes
MEVIKDLSGNASLTPQHNLHYATFTTQRVMSSMNKGSWPKPSAEIVELLAKHISRFEAEKRKMFGFSCYFVNGNMFAGNFSDMMFARFSVKDREHLDEVGLGEDFEPVQGRKMIEYRILSKKVLEDPEVLDEWLERSYLYVSSLKPKKNDRRS